ncbi:hypothetical protein EG329_014071 [Mollisiaceae sp. DMI_Dod_QoI]|nr:hypothetical protein EG329_014071 [Helotiales sp. DMI_Dod_QoI]
MDCLKSHEKLAKFTPANEEVNNIAVAVAKACDDIKSIMHVFTGTEGEPLEFFDAEYKQSVMLFSKGFPSGAVTVAGFPSDDLERTQAILSLSAYHSSLNTDDHRRERTFILGTVEGNTALVEATKLEFEKWLPHGTQVEERYWAERDRFTLGLALVSNYLFYNIRDNLERVDRNLWHSETILDVREFPDLYWSMKTTRNSFLQQIKKALVDSELAEGIDSIEAAACVVPAFLCNGLVIPSSDENERVRASEQKLKELRDQGQFMEKAVDQARREAEGDGDNQRLEQAKKKYRDWELRCRIAEVRCSLLKAEVGKKPEEIEKQKVVLQNLYQIVDGITTKNMEAAAQEANPTVSRSQIFGQELRSIIGERGNNTYFRDQASMDG